MVAIALALLVDTLVLDCVTRIAYHSRANVIKVAVIEFQIMISDVYHHFKVTLLRTLGNLRYCSVDI